MSNYSGLTNKHVPRKHYNEIFKNNIDAESNNKQMDLHQFFDAMEQLASSLYPKKTKQDSLIKVAKKIEDTVIPEQDEGSSDGEEGWLWIRTATLVIIEYFN